MTKQLQRCNSKDELWKNSGRQEKFPVDPDFKWHCQDGQLLFPTEMHTSHLYNALKMIWNHTLPQIYRIEPCNHRYRINRLTRDHAYRRRAIANLFNELMNRSDRSKGMEEGLRQMASHLHKVGKKLLR